MPRSETPPDDRLQSGLAAKRFQRELEAQVRRHRPIDLALAVAVRLKESEVPGYWTAHELLHAVESCCAFARGHRNERVTERRLREIVNVYRSYEDPYQRHVLQSEGDAQLFFQLLGRQQLELQASPFDQKYSMGRFFLLHQDGGHVRRSEAAFVEKFGLTFDSWATLCFGAYGQAVRDEAGKISFLGYRKVDPIIFAQPHVETFLKLSARTPAEVGEAYRSARTVEELKAPHLEATIRLGFLRMPIIDFGDDRLHAPLPHLVPRHAITGLDSAMRDIVPDIWSDEIGVSLEEYCATLLKGTYSGREVRRPDREAGSVDERCDLAVELDDCFFLVECKATRSVLRHVVKGNLKSDTVSRHIGKGVEQIAATAIALSAENAKPVVGFIVTSGEVFAPNTTWYWDTVMKPNIQNLAALDEARTLVCRPQVVSIAAFELIIGILRTGTHDALELMTKQVEAMKDVRQGDSWTEAARGMSVPLLSELATAAESFVGRLREKYHAVT